MAGSRADDKTARDRAKQEFEEIQRRMAEELGDKLPDVTSEEEADKVAAEWELDDTSRSAPSPSGKLMQ